METVLGAFTDPALGDGPPVVVSWRVSRWAVKIRAWAERVVDPSASMLMDTYGWTPGATLYAHYVAGALGPTKHSISLPQALQHKDVKPESASKSKLPRGMVKVAGGNNIKVNVAKLSTHLLRDQRARMLSSDGCVSNPGGPSC